MTTTNAMDTILCQDNLPDEFSRRTSSSCLYDKSSSSMATMLSGVVHAREQDVVCRLQLRRRLVVPHWRTDAAGEVFQ